jgi:CheY-like chemotaxis protein
MIKVLVVDDHQLVRVGTTRLLEDQPDITIVGEAESGEQAIDLVRSLQPDVVLMDIQMPIVGGIEATAKIMSYERDYRKKHIPIIALTANALSEDKIKYTSIGMDGYLSKPIELDELYNVLIEYCEDKLQK